MRQLKVTGQNLKSGRLFKLTEVRRTVVERFESQGFCDSLLSPC